ncbi:MAG: hypothetical protein Q9162_007898 [Coniocarpon cinnabarinum]
MDLKAQWENRKDYLASNNDSDGRRGHAARDGGIDEPEDHQAGGDRIKLLMTEGKSRCVIQTGLAMKTTRGMITGAECRSPGLEIQCAGRRLAVEEAGSKV